MLQMIAESICEVYLWRNPAYSEKDAELSFKNHDDIFGNKGRSYHKITWAQNIKLLNWRSLAISVAESKDDSFKVT